MIDEQGTGCVFKLIFENIPYGLVIREKNGKFLHINRAAFGLLGADFFEPVKSSELNAVDEDGEILEDPLYPSNIAMETCRPLLGRRVGIQKRGKSEYIWLKIDFIPYCFSEKSSGADLVFIILQDETGRKKEEDKTKLLAELLDITPASVTVHDKDGRFLYVNERTLEYHGYSKEEFLSLTLQELDVPESAALIGNRIREIIEKGETTFEVGHRRKDGKTFPLIVSAKRIKLDGQDVFLSVATDITQRKRRELFLDLLARRNWKERMELFQSIAQFFQKEFELVLFAVIGCEEEYLKVLAPVPSDYSGLQEKIPRRGSICSKIIEEGFLNVSDSLNVLFPDNEFGRCGGDSLLGMSFVDSAGRTAGCLVAVCGGRINEVSALRELMHIAAMRVAGEIECIKAENELKSKSILLEQALDGTKAALWDWWLETGQVRVNERWAEIIGYTLEELEPVSIKTWETACHPEDLKRSNEMIERCRRGETDYYDCLCRMKHRDGRWVWVQDRGKVIERSSDGRVLRMIGTHIDLTEQIHARERERIRAERKQKENDILMKLTMSESWARGEIREFSKILIREAADFFEISSVSMWLLDEIEGKLSLFEIFDRDGQIGSECREYEIISPEWLGIIKEAKYISIDEMTEPQKYFCSRKISSLLDAAIKTGDKVHGILRFEQAGQKKNWEADDISFACHLADCAGIVILNHEMKKAEARNLEMERQLFHLKNVESLGVLAGGIAHDFNNILMGILGNADLALLEVPANSLLFERLNEIIKAARKASELCQKLLAYAGKGKVIKGKINVSHAIRELESLLRSAVPGKAILEFKLAEKLPSIRGDATQICQIVLNLVTNASEALEDGSGTIRVITDLVKCSREFLDRYGLKRGLPEGDYVLLRVEDTGVGMDEETLRRLFEPFFSRKFTGRGLGLAAVQGVVRSCDGAIRVESSPGKGTIFEIYFPAETVVSAPGQSSETSLKTRGKYSGRILVVDDEKLSREVARLMLEKLGFEVVTACDGEEAIKLFSCSPEKYDMVFLDFIMPGMNGEETFRAIRDIRKDIKVILTSGYSECEIARRFGDIGFVSFIQKPYTLGTLDSQLGEVFGKEN